MRARGEGEGDGVVTVSVRGEARGDACLASNTWILGVWARVRVQVRLRLRNSPGCSRAQPSSTSMD